MLKFSSEQIKRFSRQIVLPGFGPEAQSKLFHGSALLVGAGALGCPAAKYLASMGLGLIGIMDHDYVEISNLHRQILYNAKDIGEKKVIAASRALNGLGVKILPIGEKASYETLSTLYPMFDIVLDGTDNVNAKKMLNKFCCEHKVPLISAGALGTDGQILRVIPGKTPCLECVFELNDQEGEDCMGTCDTAGVLPTITGVIGTLMANEAINVICQLGNPFPNRLLLANMNKPEFYEIETEFKHGCFCHP